MFFSGHWHRGEHIWAVDLHCPQIFLDFLTFYGITSSCRYGAEGALLKDSIKSHSFCGKKRTQKHTTWPATKEPIAAAIAAWVVNLRRHMGSWNQKFNVWHSADVASALMTDLFLSGEFYWCLVPSTLWSFFFEKSLKNRTGSQRLLDFHGVLSIQKLQVSQSLQCKSRKFQGRDLAESKSFPNKDILGDGVTYF